jgi:hypothetical protein
MKLSAGSRPGGRGLLAVHLVGAGVTELSLSRAAREIDRAYARMAARNYLRKKAKFAKEHTRLQAQAALELRRMVDDVRAELFRLGLYTCQCLMIL